jgi:Xaa-Pro dipeptidase
LSPTFNAADGPLQRLPQGVEPIVAFELGEYRDRLDRVRSLMVERELDALLVLDPRNLFYLTGAESQGSGHLQCLIVRPDDDPCLVTWDFEGGGVLLTSWLEDIVVYSWFDDAVARLVATVEGLGLTSRRLGIELRARELSAATFARLRAGLPNATFEDAFGMVERCRLTKSPAEIAHIRAAAAITDRAVQAAYAAISPGARDTDVAAAISHATYSAGSETVCWGPIVATGYGAGIMHTSVHGRTLVPGDTVFLELTGQVHRYVAPVMRTAVLGEPIPEMVEFRDAGLAVLDVVIQTARPGITAAEVVRGAAAALGSGHDRMSFHGLYGYSVGIGFPPSWFETLGFELRADNERPLESGMVFHLPISLRKYGEFGINQSQTILITDSGAEPLSRTPAALHVIEVQAPA